MKEGKDSASQRMRKERLGSEGNIVEFFILELEFF